MSSQHRLSACLSSLLGRRDGIADGLWDLMSAHNNGSGPRSNSYSENRFTNWSEYEPWWLEVQAVFKRFNGKIAKKPTFPKIIELSPSEGFIRPCTARSVEAQLTSCPAEFLSGSRAVFILSG